MAKSYTETLSFKSMKDKFTDRRQTDKKTQRFVPPRAAGEIRTPPTWHSDRGPRARSFTSKNFWASDA